MDIDEAKEFLATNQISSIWMVKYYKYSILPVFVIIAIGWTLVSALSGNYLVSLLSLVVGFFLAKSIYGLEVWQYSDDNFTFGSKSTYSSFLLKRINLLRYEIERLKRESRLMGGSF